jgi:coenzyme F420-0:L-glutamate ligase / coenzyme F420-1:gamma-L-glutamate ligase
LFLRGFMSNHQQVLSPILAAILERRSLRQYENRPVPQELIEQILTAGIYAPSAHNRQPWRFAVIQSVETKEQLARAMGARLRRDLEADHVPQSVIEKDVVRSYERLTLAPVLIVVCASVVDMDIYNDDRRNHNEYMMAVQSTAMAGQNILLAAHDSGLGTCWMCAPLFCADVVCDVLDLPEDWHPQGIISMGYPTQERTRTREPLETRVIWR